MGASPLGELNHSHQSGTLMGTLLSMKVVLSSRQSAFACGEEFYLGQSTTLAQGHYWQARHSS
jgi:hypothetical protein